jgi:chromosome segregation ATPase
VDVVSVDSVRSDTASSGMIALRRELAKLNQQAAAVEKSLDDQRRERTEALERREKERLHTLALEARVTSAEAETALVRKAHEGAIAEMRAAHETSLAELRQAREERTAFEKAAEVAKAAAASTAKEEAAAKAAKEEAAKHAAALTKSNAELARAKEEHTRDRTTARERIAVLERAVEEASAATQRTQNDLDAARQTEVRLSGEVLAAKQNAERLVAQSDAARQTEERLLAQVEAARQNEERLLDQIEAARQNEDRINRQLETALARAVEAESQALNISLQHASLEGSLRTLRDEVTGAFARVGSQAAAAAAVSSSRMLPITADLTESFAGPVPAADAKRTAPTGDEPGALPTAKPPSD